MARERLDRFLRALAEAEGSDLHVKVGSAPRIRVNGTLHRLEGEEPLNSAATADMAMAIMRPDMYEHFERNHEADFAYSVDGLGRFRVNVFRTEPTPSCHHSTLMPVRVRATTLPEIRDWFVECSR